MVPTTLQAHTHSYVEIFHDRFSQMWLNFLFQGMGGRGLVGINLRLKKPRIKKSHGVNSDHQNGKLHDQEVIHAVIELFLGLYGTRHRLVETICRPHPFLAI